MSFTLRKKSSRVRSLAIQLTSFTFWVLFIVGLLFVAITNRLISDVLIANAREAMGNLAQAKASQIGRELNKMMLLGDNLKDIYLLEPLEMNRLEPYFQHLLQENPELVSFCIAPEPGVGSSPFIYINEDGAQRKEYLPGTDYQFQDWYQIPRLTGRPAWTDPWFDRAGSEELICSYSIPLADTARYQGILRVDIRLEDLHKIIAPIKIKKTGYAWLLSGNGAILAHPADSLAMNYTIFDVAELHRNSQARENFRLALRGEDQFLRTSGTTLWKKAWIYSQPLPSINWFLVLQVSNAEVLADLRKLMSIYILPSVLAFLAVGLAIRAKTRAVNRPLAELVGSLRQVGSGDLDPRLPDVSGSQEIEVLKNSIGSMASALKQYISNLKQVTEDKSRMETEIQFASTIQRNLIPGNAVPSQASDRVSAFGILEPAGQIGGDLYDYFWIDGDNFCFAIADVVGKGIAAAMTMTMVTTYIRTVAVNTASPRVILGKLNLFLAENNLASDFVTMILGIIDSRTGMLVFSNAGHVPLHILTAGQEVKTFAATHATALGFFPAVKIAEEAVQLNPGDEIVLVTDGINEAVNDREELFGNSRLAAKLTQIACPTPETIAQSILASVRDFSGEQEPKDDITILVIEFVRAAGA